MKTHTLRGQVPEGVIKRLIIDDGRLTHAMRVTKFVVFGDPTISAGNDAMGVLGYQGVFPTMWNAADNNQFAWSSTRIGDLGAADTQFSLVDPEHLVIRDMYITGQVGSAGGTGVLNYYIEMEAIDISHDESILQLIKERNQGELRA
jgi:hypothetical protein